MNTKQQNMDLVEQIQLAMMKVTGVKRRGQHFKQHGCLNATFSIEDNLPEHLRVGIFSRPGSYNAFVRFSNGGKMDDRQPDIHGMAIKLLDVPGKKVLEGHEDETTHDFILADNPLFFIRTAAEYVPFIEDFAKSSAEGKPPERFIAWLQENRPEDLPVFLGFSQQIMDSPFTSNFWSQVPYAWGTDGKRICRYSITPSDENTKNKEAVADRGEDYLRLALKSALEPNGATMTFDFHVQPYEDVSYEVVNNPTVHWDAPTYKVATITIAAQDFDTPEQQKFGENLSYTPWHALPEHSPVGEVNEIRKQVYLSSSRLRHKSNNVPEKEPQSTKGKSAMRLSQEELTANIDDDFKEVVDKLVATFSYGAKLKKGRATHTYGVAAKARARCIVSPSFPKNDFFKFGDEFPVVLRHSSPGGEKDDRTRDGCAISLKFFPAGTTEYAGDGELDILMNAGRQLFVRSIRDFSTMVHSSLEQRTELCKQDVIMDKELTEAYRIRGSFADYRYHTWSCFEFFDAEGKMSYIRFRVIAGDRGPERGLPKPSFNCEGQLTKPPLDSDSRAEDFLRQDFIYRVNNSEVKYILQAQLHEPECPAVENSEVLNPAVAWDETFYPWMDLCEISADSIVDDNDEVSSLTMDPNRSPQCIKIPLATSPDHYASLGHARAIVYPAARAIRREAPAPQEN